MLNLKNKDISTTDTVVFKKDPHSALIEWSFSPEEMLGYPVGYAQFKPTMGMESVPFDEHVYSFSDVILHHLEIKGCNKDDWLNYDGALLIEDAEGNEHMLAVHAFNTPGSEYYTGIVKYSVHKVQEWAFQEDANVDELYQSLTEMSPDAIIIHQDGYMTFCNRAAAEMVGFDSPSECIGRLITEFVDPDDLKSILDKMFTLKNNGEVSDPYDVTVIALDGTRIPTEMLFVLTTWKGRVAYQSIVRDIRDRKIVEEARQEIEKELQWKATHDPLTGLPNRSTIVDKLELMLNRENNRQCAVIFVDLDRFKLINDSSGHATGDMVLLEVAKRLHGSINTSIDTVGRLAGDEFVILCDNIVDKDDAMDRATKVAEALNDPIVTPHGHKVTISASMGITMANDTKYNTQALLQQADMAMFRAKETGRSRIEWYDDNLRDAITRRLQMAEDLRDAINNNNLYVDYQPIGSSVEKTMVGMEALVRWNQPGIGEVPPEQFIVVAEETSLINSIGEFVLRQACSDLSAMLATGNCNEDTFVSVNLSNKQLDNPNLLSTIRSALQESNLNPNSLVLEITESTLMEDLEYNIEIFHKICQLGVRLAIDDFGTGYTSLAYLMDLPVEIMKIDKSFVDKVCSSDKAKDILAAVINLGKVFGLQICAEGVETTEQQDTLRELGCDFFQVHIFSKPVAIEDVVHVGSANEPSYAFR
jgi:diguanylate cyclase (GGDEF)-like protein/PAS domain S-box-containing protein